MAYQATVIPVMIATPGDVTEERNLIRAVIQGWNNSNAEKFKIMLEAVGWDTHSSPELGTPPQELINKRILKDCDILIAVFWTRIGTPTDKFSSGTIEEIKLHTAEGKPTMIYFSSKPVDPDSVDPEQYAQVKAIKKEWQSQGLIGFYDNMDDFQNKLLRDLHLCLSKNEYLNSLISEPAAASGQEVSDSHTLKNQNALTEEAKAILKAAKAYDDGEILNTVDSDGRTIQAGGQSFGGEYGRESAKWEAALNELEALGLVASRGTKGEVYKLTHKGWAVADAL